MKFRTIDWLALLLAGVLVGGCDTGPTLDPDAAGPVNQPGSGTESPPVLLRVDGTDRGPVCSGDLITLVGLNFSPTLEENEVLFTAGTRRVRGLPVTVRLDPTASRTNVESILDVVVPGGVSRGNVELLVRGQSAGAAGLDICPVISGFTLGLAESDPLLVYTPLGFIDGASRVTVYGLTLSDVQEVVVNDDTGNERRVPSNSFIRNPGITTPGVEPSGYDSIAFNLRDGINDIRLPFSGERGNLSLRLGSGPSGSRLPAIANRLEAPVTTDATVNQIGIVISSIKVPVGVVTGPVRVEYTCYELQVDAEWRINVEFRAVNDLERTDAWFPAKPLATSILPHNGNTGIVAGSIGHRSGDRLLPGNGGVKSFIWDAPNDPNFKLLNEQSSGAAVARPRYWRVEFRLIPVPDTDNRKFISHEAISPPIVYYNLEDRPTDSAASLRRASLVEDFTTTTLEDRRATTARWGPPLNPSLLVGVSDDTGGSQFGEGTAVVSLHNVDPLVFLEPGEAVVDEFIEFNTDRMEIIHHVISDNATPTDPADDVDAAFLEPLFDADGEPTDNPGFDAKEFHFASLTVEPATRVIGIGSLPLVIRLSGLTGNPDDIVFNVMSDEVFGPGVIDLSGVEGVSGPPPGDSPCPIPPNCGEVNGAGGRPGAGGGRGGDGGKLSIVPATAVVRVFADAQPGANFGGSEGGTPAAVNFGDPTRPSAFHGAPGGGGGHAARGQDGDYGRNNVAQYQPPKLGQGGRIRGSDEMFPATAGSGGGGGGATLARVDGAPTGPFFTAPGAGGGGGGGLIRVILRGAALIDGEIHADGGDGGDGVPPHHHVIPDPDYPHNPQMAPGGAGGAGSGGGIYLQATGPIDLASCESLTVNGGVGGESQRAGNQKGGDGAPGRIRLESEGRPLPYCGSLPVPEEVLTGDGVVPVLDIGEFGRGQDGIISLSFMRTVDSEGNPIVDSETGEEISVWTFDTATGLLRNPNGGTIRMRRPDTMDVTRLSIPENVVLRVSGPNPLRIFVRDTAEIHGTIDASGFAGGPLRFDAPGTHPLPGLGGRGGPGGGAGAAGGTIQFLDGDATNRASANTIPISGAGGGVPPGTEAWNVDNPFASGGAADVIIPPTFFPPTGGASLAGRGADDPNGCDPACQGQIDAETAGGGGGGGARTAGSDGKVKVLDMNDAAALIGHGGSAIGFDTARLNGDLALWGGLGGAGGGASANVSTAYSSRAILGRYSFAGKALYAPGTGGGGGGGSMLLRVGSLILGPTARLLARGGDAYQSIDLGGNGGGGGGGLILIQVSKSLNVDDEATIDVSGGVANRLPPEAGGGRAVYEGNIRGSFRASQPSATGEAFGGLGGTGAAGRVRVEAPADSRIFVGGVNDRVSTGSFLTNVVESVGVSLPVQLGLGPGAVARSILLDIEAPRVILSPIQPPGTQVKVLWEGARDSLDIHAAVGEFSAPVEDPRLLKNTEYVRFIVHFRSSLITRNSQSVQEIRLPYELGSTTP